MVNSDLAAGEPSETALMAAAAHLMVDGEPVIFADVLAAALLGDRAEELTGYPRLSAPPDRVACGSCGPLRMDSPATPTGSGGMPGTGTGACRRSCRTRWRYGHCR